MRILFSLFIWACLVSHAECTNRASERERSTVYTICKGFQTKNDWTLSRRKFAIVRKSCLSYGLPFSSRSLNCEGVARHEHLRSGRQIPTSHVSINWHIWKWRVAKPSHLICFLYLFKHFQWLWHQHQNLTRSCQLPSIPPEQFLNSVHFDTLFELKFVF